MRLRHATPTIALLAALFLPARFSRANELPQASVAAPQAEEVPRLAGIYEATAGGPTASQVRFSQSEMWLSAQWLSPDGNVYGRGTYVWRSASHAFVGRTVLHLPCGTPESVLAVRWVNVVVKEEIHVIDRAEILSKWTKPLGIDCATGELQFFEWTDASWRTSSALEERAAAARP
jgi:hypothetical protein